MDDLLIIAILSAAVSVYMLVEFRHHIADFLGCRR